MLSTGVTSNATGVQCCVVCNKPIIKAGKRGPRPRFCAACLAERKLEKDRRAAEKQRRKRGMAHVKGAVANCDKCTRQFVRTTRTHRFCAECAPGAALEYSREYQRRKNRAEGREQVGTLKECANCKEPFRKAQKGRQFYCAACMELSVANKLPFMRVALAKWRRKRSATDPMFALNARMRRALLHSLGSAKAGRSWESLVGYTVAQLMRHLERQFLPGMSWENRSRRQIDHIVPLASFKFGGAEHPDFRAAWSLSNLRPFWAEDNLEKRAKRLHLI